MQRLVGVLPLDAPSPALHAVVAQLKALLCLEVYESLACSTTDHAWPRQQLRNMAAAVLANFMKNTANVSVKWS